MAIRYYIYYIYYSFLGFPFVVRTAVLGVIVYTPFLLYAFYTIIISRRRSAKKVKLKKEINNKYREKIEHFISSEKIYSMEDIGSSLACKVNKLSPKMKRLITNTILELRNYTSGINNANYLKIIEYFDLFQFWEGKLKYGSTATKKKALRKLDDLGIEVPGAVITPLTYNRNPFLRKRARSYYLYFSKNDPYKFFDEEFDKTFNDWDIVEVHRTLIRRSKDGLPNLSQWLKNSNNSKFKCFIVDEIRFFRQKESAYYLLDIVKTDDDIELVRHCVQALGDINYTKAEEELITDHALQPLAIQQSIIETIGKFNTGNALGFLKDAYWNAHDTETRKYALRAIYNYGKEGRALFASMKEKEAGYLSRLLFEHVSNPLIKI